MMKSGIDIRLNDKLTGRLHVDSQGDYFVNEANLGGRFGDYSLSHISLDYTLDRTVLTLSVNNLFDTYYEYVYDNSSDGTATIHSPGDGRNLSLSARYSF